jgi:enamine deaminase RidA (YjgF/YER057c/UK114 family)
MSIEQINPASLHSNPAFSQATIAPAGRTLYVGGQNGTDADGAISGNLAAQVGQALRNLLTVLAEAGATQDDVAKMTIYLKDGVDANEAYGASMEVWGQHRTAVTVLVVAALGRPDALVEIDAVAALA